jgi:glycosyltransferase involved in cell wall biosynthesis
MLRTLQVVGGHPYGGGSYLFQKWCEYLLCKGCRVDVVRTDPYSVARLKEVRGLNVIEAISIPREIVPAQDARAFVQLVRLMRRETYDVVHTYNATPGLLGRLAARVTGVPIILHHQAGWTVGEDSPLLKRVLFTSLEYLGGLAGTRSICVSRAIAMEAKRLHTAPSSRLATICNGIDPQPFLSLDGRAARESSLSRLGIAGEALVIGNAARLVSDKDNESLVRSLGHLSQLLGDVLTVLLIAGEGPERSRLEGLASSLGVADRVRFLGFQSDIPGFLSALDVFVTPTLREGMSISLLEAMAATKPIVASSIPQNREVIEDGVTGLVVPTSNPLAIARAIARFAKDPELARACGQAARQRVLDQYTLERTLEATWSLYRDPVLGCGGTGTDEEGGGGRAQPRKDLVPGRLALRP